MSVTLDKITRENIDPLLDRHMIEVRMNGKKADGSERWWTIRRNGQTIKWKRDKNRIAIPIKGGLRVYGKITEKDFGPDGTLDPTCFRIKR